MMTFLRRIFRHRGENDTDAALQEVERRLSECVSPLILAQAKARTIRNINRGASPPAAAKMAITWATSVDHPEWM
jgi:hypothetical protein